MDNIVLRFNELILKDFKGQRDYSIKFDKNLTAIVGENGTGKTTILDALFWVFFGKDSQGAKKFDLFPLDENEDLIPDTRPAVKLILSIDNTKLELIRMQSGSATKLFINNEPKKAKEFKEFVDDIVSEKMFMTLINPVFYGNQLKWQEQKKLVLNTLTVEDVIIKMPKYTSIHGDVVKNGIDATLDAYKTQLNSLTTRKTKAQGALEQSKSRLGDNKLDSNKEELIKQRDALKDQISTIESSFDSVIQIKNREVELKGQIQVHKNKKSSDINSIRNNIDGLNSQKDYMMKEYKKYMTELNDVDEVCSMCGAQLNADKILDQRAKIQTKIDNIIEKGKTFKSQIQAQEEKLSQTEAMEYIPQNLLAELEQVKKQIEANEKTVDTEKLKSLREQHKELDSKIRQYDRIQEDMDEVKANKRKVVQLTEELEDCEILIETAKEYHQEYSQLVADKLNAEFENVKIKTFIVQKNGDIKETFDITMNGVPYKSLNSAGKIIAGVELIGLISKSLHINFPIVIDNKESITRDFDIDNQLITMSVKAGADLGV